MDFKGGAAFDECARLPHTVGMVTDLDEHLGERALRALEAELQHRERLLRGAGADNLRAYQRATRRAAAAPGGRDRRVRHDGARAARLLSRARGRRAARPHPRRAPDPRDAAARGRGQRPHPDQHQPADRAARAGRGGLGRRDRRPRRRGAEPPPPGPRLRAARPGRGRADPDRAGHLRDRRGRGRGGRRGRRSPSARPRARARPGAGEPARGDQPSDLARLVDAIVEANAAEASRPPRRPWPEPLPRALDLAALPWTATARSWRWPTSRGARRSTRSAGISTRATCCCSGIPGSGTTTGLAGARAQPRDAATPRSSSSSTRSTSAPATWPALETLPHAGSVIARRRPGTPGAADPAAARRARPPARRRARTPRSWC